MGGGNFRTIGRNLVGEGISLVKDKVRDKLFGSPVGIGENSPTNSSYEYSSVNPYSSTISIDNVKIQNQIMQINYKLYNHAIKRKNR